MSGWMCIATEKPRRRYMPDEYVLTAWSAKSSSSANAMISSRCSSMYSRLMPNTAALR